MATGIARCFNSGDFKLTLIGREGASFTKAKEKLKDQANLTFETDFESCRDADLVIESIVEDIDIKKAMLEAVSNYTPDNAIVATNTSTLSVAELSKFYKRPELFIGMHFFVPAHIMKLVEIIVHDTIDAGISHKIQELLNFIGKTTVVCKDSVGFIVNRIFCALLNEALSLYEKGVASKEDIDLALKTGLNHPMGPFELMDLIGLDTVKTSADSFYRQLKTDAWKTPDVINVMVKRGELGRKTKKGFYAY